MTIRRSQSGFTLIELLLSVVIFAVVATFATVTLATTVRLQVAHKQTSEVSAQLERAIQMMNSDVSASISPTNRDGSARNWPYPQGTLTQEQRVLSAGLIAFTPGMGQNYQSTLCKDDSECYANDSFLIMVVPVRDENGIAFPGKYEKHIYCAEPTTVGGKVVGKRLARFVSDVTEVDASGNQVGTTGTAFYRFNDDNPPNCDWHSVEGKFGNGQQGNLMKIVRADYLVADATQVLNLRFWSTWTKSNTTTQAYDAPGIRVEVSARYNAGNSNTSLGRASETNSSTPVVLRTLINRNPAYTANQ